MRFDFHIKETQYSVSVPASWNDLDLRNLLLVYGSIFHNPGSERTLHKWTSLKMISIAKHLLGIDEMLLTAWENDCTLSDAEYGEATFYDELRQVVHGAIGGLFDIIVDEDGNTTYSTKMNLTKCPYPEMCLVLKGKKRDEVKWFYAPADGLDNITIYELGMCFTLFERYLELGDEDLVHELIATMYRPSKPRTKEEADANWFGDRRMPFRKYESKVDERKKYFGELNVLQKRVILFWFACCRQAIIDNYPLVFKKRSQSEKSDYGWAGVLLELAGGPKDVEKVDDAHYSTALTWLSMKEEEAMNAK